MTDNQDSKIKVGVQTPPTDRPLTAGELEQIAHNLCSLHGFDPAFVGGQERFAKAVIAEYERARPATSAASDAEGVSDAIAFMTKAALMLDRGEMPVPGCQYAANWSAAHATVLAALASPPVSERERELEGALRGARQFLRNAPLESGICCCGDPIASHGFGSGHSPVDDVAYGASQVVDAIDRALTAQPSGEPTHG